MRTLKDILTEQQDKEKKAVFIETDPKEPFPNDTMSALKKEINRGAKDLDEEWDSAVELVDSSFDELDVPKPQLHLTKRWKQYQELIGVATKNLYDARGLGGSWRTSV